MPESDSKVNSCSVTKMNWLKNAVEPPAIWYLGDQISHLCLNLEHVHGEIQLREIREKLNTASENQRHSGWR